MFKKFSLIPLFTAVLVTSALGASLYLNYDSNKPGETKYNLTVNAPTAMPSAAKTPAPTSSATLPPIPDSYVIPLRHHTFQTFNNCGPATLSMALSYYDIYISQAELGQELRPYQIPNGDNDDKSVTLEEVAKKGEELGFTAYLRPNGSFDTLKHFIAMDVPVIARTWTKPNEDIGHYRLIRGYTSNSIIQDDSLQNKNLEYTFDEFDAVWKQFGYQYLVLVPNEKVLLAEAILGEDLDENLAWSKAVENFKSELSTDPNDIHARFNLSVSYYMVGDYQNSVAEFEKVEHQLSFRTLWYQIEPIKAYYELGNFSRVFEITDRVLNNHNRAFSELYIIRGDIYKQQGNLQAAREQYELAVLYNQNLDAAHEALASVN